MLIIEHRYVCDRCQASIKEESFILNSTLMQVPHPNTSNIYYGSWLCMVCVDKYTKALQEAFSDRRTC